MNRMTKEKMIEEIYEKVASKELSFGCKVVICELGSPILQEYGYDDGSFLENIYYVGPNDEIIGEYEYDIENIEKMLGGEENLGEEIEYVKKIGHPVMIGNILQWVDKNAFRGEEKDGLVYVDIKAREKWIIGLYNHYIGVGIDKPIEEQSKECREYVYKLIKEYAN